MHISVIIPNYNGAVFIPALCESLCAQTLPYETFDIHFVDNGSTDNSLELLSIHGASLKNLKVHHFTEAQGSYPARNYAISLTNADLLVFTDADCKPTPDWLANIEAHAKNMTGKYLISGPVELFSEGEKFNPVEWFDKVSSLRQKVYSKQKTGATANLSVSREAFECCNGFQSVKSGGDRDLCRRAVLAGAHFVFLKEALVMHPSRKTLPAIKNKLRRIGGGLAEAARMEKTKPALCFYVLKQVVGILIQPFQWKAIGRAWRMKDHTFNWKLQFSLVSLYLGAYARFSIIYTLITRKSVR